MITSTRLRHMASLETEVVDDAPRPLITLENVESCTGRLRPGLSLEPVPPRTGVADVAAGDVLFGKLRPYLAKSWVADQPVRASTELLCMRPRPEVDSRWLGYVVGSATFVDWAIATSDGAKMPRTSWEQLREFRLTVPPPSEQREIADFLDLRTAQIDGLIAGKRRMVELLNEDLEARVEEALCGPGASRVPLRRLLVAPPQYGASESGEEGQPDWPRYIRITDLASNGTLRDADVRRLSPVIAQPYLLNDWDILIARSGATVGKAFAYRRSMGPCCFAGYLIRFSFDSRKVLPGLVELWTQTKHYWSQVAEVALQATIENVSAERYKDLVIPVPPPDVQESLLTKLSAHRNRITALQSKLNQQMALLEERRAALVTAAVTGRLKIREVA